VLHIYIYIYIYIYDISSLRVNNLDQYTNNKTDDLQTARHLPS